jgi:hypothetical protein
VNRQHRQSQLLLSSLPGRCVEGHATSCLSTCKRAREYLGVGDSDMSHRAAWCVGSESESEMEEELHSLEFDVTISLVADKPKTVHRPFARRSGRRIVERMQTIRSK